MKYFFKYFFKVKVWHIPQEGLKESLSTPECTLSQKQRRVENVGFHPVADGLIHVASGHELALWDLTKQKEAFGTLHIYICIKYINYCLYKEKKLLSLNNK